MSFLILGEALVDLVTSPDGSTASCPGGSPANVAVGLGRLGLEVTLLTALGADAHGDLVRAHLRASDVVVLADRLPSTSVASTTLDAKGRASYSFDLGWRLGAVPPSGDRWLHVGSIGVTQEPGASTVARLVDEHEGIVSYDPNCRPLVMGDATSVRTRVEGQVRRSHVVKLSDEDAEWLSPGEPLDSLARRWLALGPALVVITRGPRGAAAFTTKGAVAVAAPEGRPVVDTVGAGDAFMAGLLEGLHGTTQEELRSLGPADLEPVLTRAGLIARRTCERVGADPPWYDELCLDAHPMASRRRWWMSSSPAPSVRA